ncbi:MAG: DJ-1/PfpI family protein, partial [Hymenobacter sp.]|nr:DJ-1/PfpI family protein [Hymenobacter sp.]
MREFHLLWLGLVLSLPGASSHAQQLPAATPQRPLNVVFVVYPGVEVLDLGGPMDVFIKAGRLTNGGYRCYTVSLTDSVVATEQGGLRLTPDYTFANAPKPDILVVPGASPATVRR